LIKNQIKKERGDLNMPSRGNSFSRFNEKRSELYSFKLEKSADKKPFFLQTVHKIKQKDL